MAPTGPPFVQQIQEDHPDKTVEVWYQDEARIGQQGTLTTVWAQTGTRPRAVKQTEYEWVYVFGAVNPLTGNSSAMIAPTVNTDYMNAHLAFIQTRGPPLGRQPESLRRDPVDSADGRPLRRYKRRWKVERTFAWFGNNRRLVVRYDRNIVIYRAFFHGACLILTLRRL